MNDMLRPSIEDMEAVLRVVYGVSKAKYRATAAVLHRRFVLDPPHTLRGIASDFGVTQASVYRRECMGLVRLRRSKARGEVLKIAPHATPLHIALFGCHDEEPCIAQPTQREAIGTMGG